MPWSTPYSASRSSRPSATDVENTVAPAALASWIAATPTPPLRPGSRTDSPALEPAELEQAVVGGAELDGYGGGVLEG